MEDDTVKQVHDLNFLETLIGSQKKCLLIYKIGSPNILLAKIILRCPLFSEHTNIQKHNDLQKYTFTAM